MRDRRQPELSPRVRAAIEVLKQAPSVDAGWRAALLARVRDDEGSAETGASLRIATSVSRRWSLRPMAAVAAGLACALAGAATSALILGARGSAGTSVTSADPGASSPAATALPVRFTFVAPSAAQVSLVGDFNRWDPIALPLRRARDGRTWEVEVRLPPGRYSYSFVVDGRLARDPAAPQDAADDYGSSNSVLLLRGS